MSVLTGVFRYVKHGDIAERLNAGWRHAGDLPGPHAHWSVLMWWCCGACQDGEAP